MFTGFTPETIDFLWGIRMNNNREWFTENKKNYTKFLYEPMKELGKELFEPFLNRPGNLLKVSRIYRDARMHPPEPYKESLWICIRQDVEWCLLLWKRFFPRFFLPWLRFLESCQAQLQMM